MGVEYDTDGLTDQCPIWGDMNFDDCVGCLYYRGSKEFTVFCDIAPREEGSQKSKEATSNEQV